METYEEAPPGLGADRSVGAIEFSRDPTEAWAWAVSVGADSPDSTRSLENNALLVDSGCEAHMIDKDLVLKTGSQINTPASKLCIKAAGGHRLPHHGWQTVPFKTESGVTINCRFEVSDIGRGILSVSQLVDKGYEVIFASDKDGGSRIVSQDGQTLQLRRQGGVYMLPCDLQQKRAEPQACLQTMPVDVALREQQKTLTLALVGPVRSQSARYRSQRAVKRLSDTT